MNWQEVAKKSDFWQPPKQRAESLHIFKEAGTKGCFLPFFQPL